MGKTKELFMSFREQFDDHEEDQITEQQFYLESERPALQISETITTNTKKQERDGRGKKINPDKN